ncbi:MAG: sugar transferase [Alphaproteobacteria bacterium]|nr:sugar transferase [Alphaproteobacteria bacterium]
MNLKRAFDISAAMAGAALLSPLFVALAAGGALHFRGNPFHLTHRVGKDGQSFQMIKFKSMVDGDQDDDSRTSGYGRFLRSTALDELPQIFNIIKGDMSFVGPRPREQIVSGDDAIPDSHKDILAVRPGLTGPWQVAAIGLKTPMSPNRRLDLDAAYARSQPGLGTDLKLIMKTIPAFIKGHDGEYPGKPKGPLAP